MRSLFETPSQVVWLLGGAAFLAAFIISFVVVFKPLVIEAAGNWETGNVPIASPSQPR